ncbi:helix-turn-helix domain-containing protein [Dyella silvatica]
MQRLYQILYEQYQRIRTLRQEDQFSVRQLAKRFNVGPATIYRAFSGTE